MLELQSLCFSLLLLVGVALAVHNYSRIDFPPAPHFVFGSATSAYQVEGAAFEDGRTPSIWDTFAHAGHEYGANGDIACDGYHKYKEDVQLMVEAGLEAYRFSISWSRLIPNGRGPVNPKGLDYYNSLINELIKHGIQPHASLFHFDTPQALEDQYGGWLSRKTIKYFTAYADVCFREFGDRVFYWTTIDEGNIFPLGGYDVGISPPGHCSSPFGINCTAGNSSSEPYTVGHHLLLAHASAARLYWRKYKAKQHGFIGLNVFAYWFEPYTNTTQDEIATQRATDFYTGWFVNPLVFGDYPDIIKKNAGARIPTFSKHESRLVKSSFDFLGINHYITVYVKDDPSGLEMNNRDFDADMAAKIIFFKSDSKPQQFPIRPLGLHQLLEYFKNSYGNPPIYIHENGMGTERNGTLNDTKRVQYIHAFIGSLLDALRNGSNVQGYFTWSFLDVFELMSGYRCAYGLYFVDLNDKDLKRYPKSSAHWYSNFLKGRSISLDEPVKVETSAASF